MCVLTHDPDLSCNLPADSKDREEEPKLQQNPLFTASDLGCAHMVLSALHPCVREALQAKDKAVHHLLQCTSRLNVAANVVVYATSIQPEHTAASNARTCTELAVIASKDAVQKYHAAEAVLLQRLVCHPPPTPENMHLFDEYTNFVCDHVPLS